MNESLKDRIFDAAVAELLSIGIDNFSIERVSRRAGVDASVITDRWHDRRVLLMDTMLSRAGESNPSPDTGDLAQDLQSVTDAAVAVLDAPWARKWFHRLLPHGRDADLYEVGPDFWEVRLAASASILERAAQRGELREGIDPRNAYRMFCAALCFDPMYNDAPVQQEYASQLIEIFIRGISR